MEYLKSGWKTVVGAPSDDNTTPEQNVAETVPKLIHIKLTFFKFII